MIYFLGLNIEQYMADNNIGPIWQPNYFSLSMETREAFLWQQRMGEKIFGDNLEINLIKASRYNDIRLDRDRDLKTKLHWMRRAVDATPINEFLSITDTVHYGRPSSRI